MFNVERLKTEECKKWVSTSTAAKVMDKQMQEMDLSNKKDDDSQGIKEKDVEN